jgi:hypothetical protein
MFESLLVGIIVAAAVIYAVRELARNARGGDDQCSNCSLHERGKDPGEPR